MFQHFTKEINLLFTFTYILTDTLNVICDMSNTSNQHEQLSNFINNQIDIIRDSTSPKKSIQEADIPEEVLKLINSRLETLRSQNVTQVAKDIITRNVIDMEYDRNLEERKEIIKMLHLRNISKINTGSDSYNLDPNDDPRDNYYNLDYLIDNIYKLPELATTDSRDENQLKEYKILREELINHCRAIKIGENELKKLKLQCDKLDSLKSSIIETTGTDDIKEYITIYNQKIAKELEELTYNLEIRLKTLDPKDKDQIKKLQSILRELK